MTDDLAVFLLARVEDRTDEHAAAVRAAVDWHDQATGEEKEGAWFVLRQFARGWADHPDYDPTWL